MGLHDLQNGLLFHEVVVMSLVTNVCQKCIAQKLECSYSTWDDAPRIAELIVTTCRLVSVNLLNCECEDALLGPDILISCTMPCVHLRQQQISK